MMKAAVGKISLALKGFALTFTMLSLIGCTPQWEKTKAPDITSSDALTSVFSFVATNGWDTAGSNKTDTLAWEDFEPKYYITGLPWKNLTGQQFQAQTEKGIFYVLLGDEFHHDYYGVAYNPNTNRFPDWIRGFKPIGGHWYVWAQPEFWYTATTRGRYE